MSTVLSNLTKNIEKHSTCFERMNDNMETITADFEDGLANILKKIGQLSNKFKVYYTDINGNYRQLDPNADNDASSMDTDTN